MKYFNSQIAQEYKAIEKIAQQKLVDMVPDELRDIFEPLIDEHHYSEEEQSIVKQADAPLRLPEVPRRAVCRQ
ncbi:Nucleotidase YfbR, HD superfamily [Klebsiella aerogenes]|nr:Nucleotidase YfbR, HD superfamily [Klebsiella aerogenes]